MSPLLPIERRSALLLERQSQPDSGADTPFGPEAPPSPQPQPGLSSTAPSSSSSGSVYAPAANDAAAPTVSPSAQSSAPHSSSSSGLRGGIIILAIVLVFLGVCFVVFIAWRLWVVRKQRAAPPAYDAGNSNAYLSEAKSDAGGKPHVSERSRVAPWTDVPVPAGIQFPTANKSAKSLTSVASSPSLRKLPPANATPRNAAHRLSTRSASLAPGRIYPHDVPPVPALEAVDFPSTKPRLPRRVVAVSTFSTTLADELDLNIGETLRLLEEYADDWCLVQRVGGKKERGVVPRFCVEDLPADATSS